MLPKIHVLILLLPIGFLVYRPNVLRDCRPRDCSCFATCKTRMNVIVLYISVFSGGHNRIFSWQSPTSVLCHTHKLWTQSSKNTPPPSWLAHLVVRWPSLALTQAFEPCEVMQLSSGVTCEKARLIESLLPGPHGSARETEVHQMDPSRQGQTSPWPTRACGHCAVST